MQALRCPLCHKDSVVGAPPESLFERAAGLLAIVPFRCRFCSHRFLALRWGRRQLGSCVERREFRRMPVQLALAFTGDQVRGEGTIVDLSVGGCLIRSTLHLCIDDIIYLRVTLPSHEAPLELAAMVRSVGSRGIGCKFLRATREDARLAALLREQEEGAVRPGLTRSAGHKAGHRTVGPTPSAALRVEPVEWGQDEVTIRFIRETVFVREQGVPLALEWDGLDSACRHLLAWNDRGEPIGTARLHQEGTQGRLGRMAVLKDYRGRGVGQALLRRMLHVAQAQGMTRVYLSAQVPAVGFYEREGFQATGDPFDDAGIPHRVMALALSQSGEARS